MSQQLSNLDYLIGAVKGPAKKAFGPGEAEPQEQVRSGPDYMQQATVALGGAILQQLEKAGGKLSAFQLVDATKIPLETLFRVLDSLASEYHWVNVDKSDPKGDYQVELRPEAREYLKKFGL